MPTIEAMTADYLERRLGDLAPLEGKAIRLRRDQWEAIIRALRADGMWTETDAWGDAQIAKAEAAELPPKRR